MVRTAAPLPDRAADLAAVAHEVWIGLDEQRSRDARLMSPKLRALQDRLAEALQAYWGGDRPLPPVSFLPLIGGG